VKGQMMYKTIIELGKINNGMKLKFGLVIRDDTPKANMKFQPKLIDKFVLGGGEYLKITPHPYLVIDISGSADKGETWNNNKSITLGDYGIFIMLGGLQEALKNIRNPDMFKYMNNHLMVNKELAKRLTVSRFISNKKVILTPVVVYDENNAEIEYEGFAFMIDTMDNFCMLTLEEAEFLMYKLRTTNLIGLSLQVIQTVVAVNKTEAKKIEKDPKPVAENTNNEIAESNINKIKPATEIPDLEE
jgi:hypothetical protein